MITQTFRMALLLTLAALSVGFTEVDPADLAYREKHYKEAYQLFSIAADRGSAQAQYMLAGLLERGLGTEKNFDEARRQYLRAAAAGHVGAQVEAARMLENGLGGPGKLPTGLPDTPQSRQNWRRLGARSPCWLHPPQPIHSAEQCLGDRSLQSRAADTGIDDAFTALAAIYRKRES